MRPSILNLFFSSVESLPGIGSRVCASLSKLLGEGSPCVRDLLFHLPVNVIDRRRRPLIADAERGVISTILVEVVSHHPPPAAKKNIPYRVLVRDDSGEMSLVFFHGRALWLEKQLPVGSSRYVSGKVEEFNGRLNIVHPDHIVTPEEFASFVLVEPVYPLSAGLSQKVIGKAIRSAVEKVPELLEWIDSSLTEKHKFVGFNEALNRLHNPRDIMDISPTSPATKRLAYDELLAGQLALSLVRARVKKVGGKSWKSAGDIRKKIVGSLPYKLTSAQERCVGEILGDMSSSNRMLRLLQGDVGSGKTIVALLSAATVIESGGQAALMAPTEILARQHYATLCSHSEGVGIRIALLTGREKGKERQTILKNLKEGEIDLLVGTHALFTAEVEFSDLGLAIVDEQHRFGVHQRFELASKGDADILLMTATPIPRTLVLTFFGDMDVSRLDEKPEGRGVIKTNAVSTARLDELMTRVGKAIQSNKKVYWICPVVEEDNELSLVSAEGRYNELRKRLGGLGDSVGLVHGRMKGAEKDSVMESFRSGDLRLLVATTVIEVGVDVSDATIIVIEHAERFGLAQLHQLRGRVGRGDSESTCLLLYRGPLSETAKARISVMRETDDGFRIAEEDLRLRGEGEILGTRQSGEASYRLAQMEYHADLLESARDDSRMIMETNPELEGERGAALRTLLYLFSRDESVRLLRAG